eukprot:gnl/TRDRNA2_/TRDRNA2_165030_c0_seq1.p1 gnl/TRDRNA2_/TRDRNA2_165030_c0~~gnl/TRDRNA2_/TRDRNA2_165030_c0_seq1.p1  ORF type:complete len:581 (-),score=79.24 gnl/TRDRNA2_/TRDRNA2_165030_c0_seq1:107-1849(-)
MILLFEELRREAQEPARAVLPLALYLISFTDIVQWYVGVGDGSSVFKAEMLLGVPTVVCGLALFKWGLRKGLMPLGTQLGERLPELVGVGGVSAVSFVLAIGLTFAEPAIGALQEAATLLDTRRCPLLAAIFFGNSWCVFALVLAIGLGVGFAAVIGSLRLLHSWDIKRMLFWALLPCLLVTMAWSAMSEELGSIAGLAWDSGAVTTGPVTVPVVLALGIGLAKSSRRRLDEAEMEGTSFDDADIYRLCESDSEGLPHYQNAKDLEGFGIVAFASLFPVLGVLFLGAFVHMLGMKAADDDAVGVSDGRGATDAHVPGLPETKLALRSIGPLVIGFWAVQKLLIAEPLVNSRETALGVCCVFFGLVLFNVGLNFGLLPLGDAAGERMAIAFRACQGRGSVRLGTALVLCFAFIGSFAAQIAEPSLNVLGETVEGLTNGNLKRRTLVYVVAFGVACGTCTGVLKVLWDLSFWKILLPMYCLSFALTTVSSEGITCVAWDAGGVTTGSVTVPLILAMGLGLGKRCDPPVVDAFGLLGCASVFPIVTVLLAGLVLDRSSRSIRSSQEKVLLPSDDCIEFDYDGY